MIFSVKIWKIGKYLCSLLPRNSAFSQKLFNDYHRIPERPVLFPGLGLVVEKPDIIDKYCRKHKSLGKIFPSHFAKIYETASKISKNIAKVI
jgi:hypothetical protein